MARSASSPSHARTDGQRGTRRQGTLPIAARRHPLVAEVRNRLSGEIGLPDESRLVLGVSGGADSLALLISMIALREHRRGGVHPEPVAAYINHGLRQAAADEAAHVREIADRFHVPFEVREIQPDADGGNLPEQARLLRYRALASVAHDHGARFVAVAHHAEDQFESMLMALCRGTGLDGLRGMAWTRPMDEASGDGMMLVRPLLRASRHLCESICDAAGLDWCEDASNRDVSRRRNRLRHEVVPVFESMWPGAADRAAVSAELLSELAGLLEAELARHFGSDANRRWPRRQLSKLSAVMVAAGLRRAALAFMRSHRLTGIEGQLTRKTLMPAAEGIIRDCRSPKQFELAPGVTVTVTSNTVELGGRDTAPPRG